MGNGELIMLGVTLRWTIISHPGGVELLLVALYFRNQDKLQPDGPFGLYADFTYWIGFVLIYFVVIFYILKQLMFGGKSKTANIFTDLNV